VCRKRTRKIGCDDEIIKVYYYRVASYNLGQNAATPASGGQPRSLFARLSNDTAALQNLTVTQITIT
jgi:hypothetical protein